MTGHAGRLLKAVGALAVLVAVIVGVPVLLVTLGLVPHGLPSFDEVLSHLTARDDGQLVQVLLAAGAWVCWALFTTSTAAELAGLVRTRPAPRTAHRSPDRSPWPSPPRAAGGRRRG